MERILKSSAGENLANAIFMLGGEEGSGHEAAPHLCHRNMGAARLLRGALSLGTQSHVEIYLPALAQLSDPNSCSLGLQHLVAVFNSASPTPHFALPLIPFNTLPSGLTLDITRNPWGRWSSLSLPGRLE